MNLPELTPHLQNLICEEYMLPSTAEFLPLWISQNRTYLVTTSTGSKPKILRIYRNSWRTSNALMDELKVLSFISENSNIIIPKPILNRKGDLLTTVIDQNVNIRFAFFSYISGIHISRVTHSRMFKLGAGLAQLDNILVDADNKIKPNPSKSRITWDHEALIVWPLKSLEKVVNNPDHYGLDHLDNQWLSIYELAERLMKNFCYSYQLLPKQLLHADATFPNVKFCKRGVGILDFDEMGYGARVYELTPPLCSPQIFSTSISYAPDLVAGYKTRVNLTELEIRSLPLFVAARLFGSLGWAADHKDIPWARDLLQTAGKRLKHIAALIESYENNDKILGIAPIFYGIEPYSWSYYSSELK